MPTEKIKILIASPKYPPRNDIGTNRVASFARYLDKERFEVFVLTEEHHGDNSAPAIPGVQVERVPNGTRWRLAEIDGAESKPLHYLKSLRNLAIRFLGLDYYGDWRIRAIARGDRLIRQHGIAVAITSFAPEASHRVGAELKRLNPSIRWIADMRDEMTSLPNLGPVQRRHAPPKRKRARR